MIEIESTIEARFAYPVALNVVGRRCVVVGGGPVGARRATGLADAGAAVIIVSPTVCPDVELVVGYGAAQHIAAEFAPAHLSGAFLVIAATDSPVVNAFIARTAADLCVLCNLAAPGDDNGSGDFATLAAMRRGDLMFAVTTGGAGPALSAKLRRDLSDRYGAEWGAVVALMGKVRDAAKEALPDTESRTAAMRTLANNAERLAFLIEAGDTETAWKEAFACLIP